MPALRLVLPTCLLLALAGHLAAATVWVDANTGDDAAAGSEAAPWKTLAKALGAVKGGDTVLLRDGSYGGISSPDDKELLASKALFTDWVEIAAAPGAKPILSRFSLGIRAGTFAGKDGRGTYDIHLRCTGLTFSNGIRIYGGRKAEFRKCRIERSPPWVGDEEAIEKVAVSFGAGSHLLLQDCEITNTAVGIALNSGGDMRILNNHIHDITHDGIRCVGAKDALIEGNRIHGLDDGVDDSDAAGKGWNRHCDGIHIFISGPGEPGMQNRNLTFRNNVIYDCESQGVQFNNYLRSPDVRNERIVFEGNIFGPTRANAFNNADPVDGLVFRHNTFIPIPGGRRFGRITASNTTLRISGESTGVQVYNNILGDSGVGPRSDGFIGFNLVQGKMNKSDRFSIQGDPGFVAPEAFDGRLKPTSPAVNAGTRRLAPEALPETDLHGTPRDARPDLGAVELPGQKPEPEAVPPTATPPITRLVDDFTDGDWFQADPWLAGPNTQGLAWTRGKAGRSFSVGREESGEQLLEEPHETGKGWLFATDSLGWTGFQVELDVTNAYLTKGGGPLLFARDEGNAYWFDLGREAGRLIRFMSGPDGTTVRTELAAHASLRMPHQGTRRLRLSVRRSATGIDFASDANGDGKDEFTFTDRDPQALKIFVSGGLGFHRDAERANHRLVYDNIRVTLTP